MYRDVDRGTFEKDRELIEWVAQTMARFADALRPRVVALQSQSAQD